MSERMSGSDAVLWHMEDDETPLHTLKVVVLDTSRRGRAVTLDELAVVVGSRLGLVPRATQKVVPAPGFGARPYWVDDPDFDLGRHLQERWLAAPGDRGQLDELYGELATAPLPRDRSPWAMTLVHGLKDGRQAVVLQVHHAIADGLAALHTFVAATTEEPGEAVPLSPAPIGTGASRARLAARAAGDAVRTWRGLPGLLRSSAEARARAKAFRHHPDIPRLVEADRTPLNVIGDGRRVCASSNLDLATVRAISKATGTTVNGVLHAVLAGALRDELESLGADVRIPMVAAFGVASDRSDTDRRIGNQVTPTFVRLRTDLADPRLRLDATARSCVVAVEARRAAGLDLSDRWSAFAPRAMNWFRRTAAATTSLTFGHVVTANVAGPRQRRWFGDIEVVDWISFAVAVSPASVNLTVHSYDGRMNIGLVAETAALPEPHRLLARLDTELAVLAKAVLPSETVAA